MCELSTIKCIIDTLPHGVPYVRNKLILFSCRYSTANGAAREEIVQASQVNDKAFLVISGVSSYIDDDGYRYLSNYIADENGYRSKVLFGTNVMIKKLELPYTYSAMIPSSGGGGGGGGGVASGGGGGVASGGLGGGVGGGGGGDEGIDGVVLCSLLGRGCK